MKKLWLFAFIAVFSGICLAQRESANAIQIPDNTIILDGQVNEDFWLTIPIIEVLPILHPNTGYTLDPVVTTPPDDPRNDIRGTIRIAWDNAGLYVGKEFFDDIHTTPFAASASWAGIWKDDSHEWWINPVWGDVATDMTKPMMGEQQLGSQFMQSLFIDNFAIPADNMRSIAFRHGDSKSDEQWPSGAFKTIIEVATADECKVNGFYAPYSTQDGINYQCEAFFSWDAQWMKTAGGQKISLSDGHELGLNVAFNDNDDGTVLAMRWTGSDVNEDPAIYGNLSGWGKVTLKESESSSISLPRNILKEGILNRTSLKQYDIFGREILSGKQINTAIGFSSGKAQIITNRLMAK